MPNYIRNAQTTLASRGAATIYSIWYIELQYGLKLFIFPVSLIPNDIWLKYRKSNSRVRSTKQINWSSNLYKIISTVTHRNK